jgi:hypothetical protein
MSDDLNQTGVSVDEKLDTFEGKMQTVAIEE